MKVINVKKNQDITELAGLTKRNREKLKQVADAVEAIIKNVQENGDEALREYARQFDKVELEAIRVTPEEIEEGYNSVSPELIEVLTEARDNIRAFHEKQVYAPVLLQTEGKKLYQMVTPVKRAGLYVPGGNYPYPSTVLMDAVPAIVAGVKEIAIITPAKENGKVSANILAAAKVCGITEVYKSGGAQAIAALAYGTETIKPVDMICGPGNVYVTAAKRSVFGDVNIDMLAGPSEVLVIADEKANPKYVAADFLSQAEHDTQAAAILITTSEELAEKVQEEVIRQLNELPTKEVAEKSVSDYGTIFITEDLQSAFDIANEIAPEHLELALENAEDYVKDVYNAGTVFVGEYTPEPIGDYFAGTNHTIPTSGTAKFYSPLSTYDFMKRTSVVKYEKSEFDKVAEKVMLFAETEGLFAHRNSIKVRTEE